MKLVKEWGSCPPDGQIHNLHCRGCGCKYSALTKDKEKHYNYKGFWKLIYTCPCCNDFNEISVDKDDKMWDDDKVNTDVQVAPKGNYNGTF